MNLLKKSLFLFRNIITVRPLRKFIQRKLAMAKLDAKYKDLPKFNKSVAIRQKSVLVCEPHFGHGECLPGWTKYFQDLGYSVDIITRYENYIESPFCNWPTPPRIFAHNLPMLKKLLGDKRLSEYEYIFIATSVIWDFLPYIHFCDYLGFIPQGKHGCLFVDHAPNAFFNEFNEKTLVRQHRIFTLSDVPEMPQLNPHYFGEFMRDTKKNERTTFVAIGKIAKNARNYDYMIEAAKKLSGREKDFAIRIIGSGKIKIPAEPQGYITHLGRLDYPKMYAEIERADFIIAGLDPFAEEHHQYFTGCTTGNLQLSYGFCKPMIINEMFGKHYGLSDKNAVLYPDNDITDAMARAVEMDDREYRTMQFELKEIAQAVYEKSLVNLRAAVNSDHKTGIKTNMALLCKTYIKNLPALKILKDSIDTHNIDKIPFYIVCPSADLPRINEKIITGSEDYRIAIMPEEPILAGDSLGDGWLDQQIIKLKFYKTKLADFYLVLDTDSYFIRDFFVDDFMYDDKTPYIVCHEGKAGTLLNTKFGNTSAMFAKEQFVKRYLGRTGKNYRGLTSPFMFSSAVCRALDNEIDAAKAIKLCSCEAAWHLEYLLKNGGMAYKPTELFFEAIVYPKKLRLWRKLGLKTADISKQYLGIVMQDKLLKEHTYEK